MRVVGSKNLSTHFILLLAFVSSSSQHGGVSGQLVGSIRRHQLDLQSERTKAARSEADAYWARHLQEEVGSTSQPSAPPTPPPTSTQPSSPTTAPSGPANEDTPTSTPTSTTSSPRPPPGGPTNGDTPTPPSSPTPTPSGNDDTPTSTPTPTPPPPLSPPPAPGGPPNGDTSTPPSIACCPNVARVPAVTALEYLGAGYNIFEGNPRGGLTTELDPGFRNGVVKLIPDESMLTLNREFAVPLGTEHRYTTTCMFSSTSSEVSTTSQYQRELSREAMVTSQTSVSASALGLMVEHDEMFSRSEKFRSFARDRLETQTTTFQSRALCTEFEARLQRFHDHEFQDAFVRALNSLPSTYDEKIDAHKDLFGDFLKEYGTHYVNYVVLGAKQVYSLEMNSIDVARLRELGVEVSTSTSSKTMFSFDSGQLQSLTKVGEVLGSNNTISIGGSTSNSATETTSKNDENLNMIREMTKRIVETNIGGTPPADGQWQTWAATAKSRPMPIVYELSELSELMTEQVARAFSSYVNKTYLAQEDTDELSVLHALHYGVAQPKGKPISAYTSDPTSGLRTLTEFRKRNSGGKIVPDPAMNSTENNSLDNFHRYNFSWEGSGAVQSAVFLTLIRDNVSPNEEEDSEGPQLLTTNPLFENYPGGIQIPFGFSLEPGKASAAIFGVTDENKLNSFTYLAADNLPTNANYKAGVVHPQGYPTNRVFDKEIGFEVSQKNDREFIVTFTPAFNETPTLLAFPLWYPMEDTYPTQFGDVMLAIRGCNTTVCRLQVGAPLDEGGDNKGDVQEDQYLGFSFVAFDGALKNVPGLVHGNYDDSTGDEFGDKGYRASLFNEFSVLIEFEKKFQDIPSVTVTPRINEEQLFGKVLLETYFALELVCTPEELLLIFSIVPLIVIDPAQISEACVGEVEKAKFFAKYKYPTVYIEHVTPSQVLIRAMIVSVESVEDTNNINSFYTRIPFSFVAVGPLAKT